MPLHYDTNNNILMGNAARAAHRILIRLLQIMDLGEKFQLTALDSRHADFQL